jgi:hypothetical protein
MIASIAKTAGTYSLSIKDDSVAHINAVRLAITSYLGAINFLLITCANAIKTPQPKVIDNKIETIPIVYQNKTSGLTEVKMLIVLAFIRCSQLRYPYRRIAIMSTIYTHSHNTS